MESNTMNATCGIDRPDLDLPRLEAYVTKVAAAADDFFRFLTDVSRP
jgi:hypothetical protein